MRRGKWGGKYEGKGEMGRKRGKIMRKSGGMRGKGAKGGKWGERGENGGNLTKKMGFEGGKGWGEGILGWKWG